MQPTVETTVRRQPTTCASAFNCVAKGTWAQNWITASLGFGACSLDYQVCPEERQASHPECCQAVLLTMHSNKCSITPLCGNASNGEVACDNFLRVRCTRCCQTDNNIVMHYVPWKCCCSGSLQLPIMKRHRS